MFATRQKSPVVHPVRHLVDALTNNPERPGCILRGGEASDLKHWKTLDVVAVSLRFTVPPSRISTSKAPARSASGTSPAPRMSAARDLDRRFQRIVRSPDARGLCHSCSTRATGNGRSLNPVGARLLATEVSPLTGRLAGPMGQLPGSPRSAPEIFA